VPLLTDDINEARSAYTVLETRAQNAEQRAQGLQLTLDQLRNNIPVLNGQSQFLRQRAIDQESANAQLRAQGIAGASPDIPLDAFIASLGLAAALGEASMPGSAISSISSTTKAYLVVGTPSETVRLRFYQPELGSASGLSSTTVQIEKVPPALGFPSPRNLYAVLADKQSVYTSAFWLQFPPSAQIIGQIAMVFANTGAWTFPLLVQSAGTIASLEKTLAAAVPPDSPPLSAYVSAVASLSSLAGTLVSKAIPVSGDLLELTAALDGTTTVARRFLK
jgi:hypothetical protein